MENLENIEENTMIKSSTRLAIMGWSICLIGALFYSYEYFLRIMPSVMSAKLMAHFNIEAGALGIFVAIYYWAYVPLQLPVGLLHDRFGPRRLLTFACLLCVVGTYMFGISHSIYIAATGRLFVGIGSAFAFVGVLKLASIWLPADRFALVAGLTSALGTVGAIVGEKSLASLVEHTNIAQTIYISVIAGLLIAFLIWVFVRDESPYSAEVKSDDAASFAHVIEEMIVILRNPQIWVVGLIGCLIYLPTTIFAEQWAPLYLEQARGFTIEQAANATSALFLGFTMGAPLAGFISDRIHKRRLPLFVGALATTVVSAAAIYLPNLTPSMMEFVLFALGIAYGSQTLVFAIGKEISPDDAPGTAIAVTNMLVMLGGMFLQPIVGYILSLYGPEIIIKGTPVYSITSYQCALAVLPIGAFVSVVLVSFLKESMHLAKKS